MRLATIIVCLLDTAFWIAAVVAYSGSVSEPATAGLDNGAGVVVTALFLVTAVPAFVLVMMRRSPKTALALSLAFPAVFITLFVAVIVLLP